MAPDTVPIPEWRWLPGAQRYYDLTKHRFVASKQVRDWAWQSVTASRDTAKTLANNLAEQRLTVADWQTLMRRGIKDEYIRQYVLGKGGLDQMTKKDWGSVGGMLAESYGYLDGFAKAIADGNLTEVQIGARAAMYFNSSQEAFWRATERVMGIPNLPAMPGDGSTKCLCILSPESRVLTSRGWLPIADIRVGDSVLTHRLRWRPVTALIVKPSHPYHRQAVITTPTGADVSVTHDHRWLTADGWRGADDIDFAGLTIYSLGYGQAVSEMRSRPTWQQSAGGMSELPADMPMRTVQRETGCAVPNVPSIRTAATRPADMYALRGADAGQQPARRVQTLPTDMFLWSDQGSRRDFVPVLSQQGTIRSTEAPASPIKAAYSDLQAAAPMGGLIRCQQLAHETRWPFVYPVLGRDWSSARDLSLPVALDRGQRTDSSWSFGSSPRRDHQSRRLTQSRIDDSSTAPESAYERSQCAAEYYLQPFRPTITFRPLAPGTHLYDIVVAEDHSFVVEGLVSHNTNCRCQWLLSPIYNGRGKTRKLLGYNATWHLGAAEEHCDDGAVDDQGRPRGCVQRAALWNPLVLMMPGQEEKALAPTFDYHSEPHVGTVMDSATLSDFKGGPGSGNFGHSGRPGKVGGSSPGNDGVEHTPSALTGNERGVDWRLKPEFKVKIEKILLNGGVQPALLDGLTITDQPHPSVTDWKAMGVDAYGYYDAEHNTLGVNPISRSGDAPSLDSTVLHEVGHRFSHLVRTGSLSFPDARQAAAVALLYYLHAGYGGNPTQLWRIYPNIKADYGLSFAGLEGMGEFVADLYSLARTATPAQRDNWSTLLTRYNARKIDIPEVQRRWIPGYGQPVPQDIGVFMDVGLAHKGGSGSGNFGHAGRPGKVGGSASSNSNGTEHTESSTGQDTVESISLGRLMKDDLDNLESHTAAELVINRLAKRWQVDRPDLIEFTRAMYERQKEILPEIEHWSDDRLKEEVMGMMVHDWAGSSGSFYHIGAIAAVADQLHLPWTPLGDPDKGPDYPYPQSSQAALLRHARTYRASWDRVFSSAGTTIYDYTQEWLAQRGIHEVTVYRRGNRGSNRLFTSWSASPGSTREGSGKEIISERVPARFIFSTAATGFGTLGEEEVVLLPRPVAAIKGGPGSGNFGHAGRPGHVGGSGAGNGTEHTTPAEHTWRPTMSRSEANAWASDSVLPQAFYHGTGRTETGVVTEPDELVRRVNDIRSGGFRIDIQTNGHQCGPGVYLTEQTTTAQRYGKVLEVRVRVHKVFDSGADAQGNEWTNWSRQYARICRDNKKSGRNLSPTERISYWAKTNGYDGIRVGPRQLVVFDPHNVVVVE